MSSSSSSFGDRLSEFPDGILSSIISFLPLQELLDTAFLSKRWRDLWTFAPQLNLVDMQHPLEEEAPTLDVVLSRILARHKSSRLPICRISSSSPPSQLQEEAENKNVDKKLLLDARWITSLTLKGVTILSLRYDPAMVDSDPSQILTIPTLQQLVLDNYKFSSSWHPPATGLLLLRFLRIANGSMHPDALTRLISSAPLLEDLGLSRCWYLTHPHISSKVLKRLDLEDFSIHSIKIDTPALTTLGLRIKPIWGQIKINVPSLCILNTIFVHSWWGPSNNIDLLNRILCRTKKKRFPMHRISPNSEFSFLRLRKLCLGINLKFEWDIETLLTLLGICPYLQELGIRQTMHLMLDFPWAIWRTTDTFYCLEHHMTHLWIKGYRGCQLGQEFVTFILSKALMLKRLEISYQKNCSADTVEALESILQKASTNLTIIVTQEG